MKHLLNTLCITLLFNAHYVLANSVTQIADSHVHYNWDQAEIITPDEITAKLNKANISLAIVSSTPSHLALQLKSSGNVQIVPFFSPYIHEMGKKDWYKNNDVVEQARLGLEKGDYQGIGEIHFMSGRPPSPNNAVFLQLMSLAKRYHVPALIHVDAGNEEFFLAICSSHPDVNIQFAHAGGNLEPAHLRVILEQCHNVWIDLSARDPWRYGAMTNTQGELLHAWRKIILDYPQRFIIGSDPVWRVTRTQSWDLPDEGWQHFEQLLAFHLRWLQALPETVQARVLWQNTIKLLKKHTNEPGSTVMVPGGHRGTVTK